MGLYLGIHDMGKPLTEDEMKSIWEAYKLSCDKHGCKALRVHANAGEGKAFCLTEAASADEVLAAHKESDKPSEPDVIEVQIIE
jgi:uncharacterized protein DUF4242